MKYLGAEIEYFSPVYDKKIPENVDILYFGGGYPENFARELSENKSMIESVNKFYHNNGKIFGECGGFMFLSKEIETIDGEKFPMCSLIDCSIKMGNRLDISRFGYISLLKENKIIGKGHEFHYSKIKEIGNDTRKYTARKKDGREWNCIFEEKGLKGGYPHIHFFTSFDLLKDILEKEGNKFDEATLPVIKRVIHTTADFEYADLIEFMNDAINSGKEALKKGCKIYCDTNMIVNGASKMVLSKFNCEAYCLVADSEVVKEAKEKGVTRSIVGMEKAAKDPNTKIFLIGNAPTALYRLKEMIERNEIEKPALVVGVPVGFVGAAESKEAFKSLGIPYITINGRKGGSTVAVSILHGILYQMYQREGF